MEKKIKELLEECKDCFEYIIDSEYVNWDALREYSCADIMIEEINKILNKEEK